jgi:hypothetical protein
VLFATGNSLTRAELVAVCPKPLVEWDEEVWPEPRWWEEMHISECMMLAARGHFDLVHNHMHAKALPFMSALSVPVLTTLYGAARDRQLHTILQRFKDFPFVALDAEERSRLPELNYVADIPFPPPEESNAIPRLVDRYEEVYKQVVAGRYPGTPPRWRRLLAWGSIETVVDDGAARVVKVQVAAARAVDNEDLPDRRGHWTVLAGRVNAVIGAETRALGPGQAVDVAADADARIENPGPEPAALILVQTPAS